MNTQQPPNRLRCGCQLGPTIELCETARILMAAKKAAYRKTVAYPFDVRAKGRYMRAGDAIEAHWTNAGAYENGPAGGHRRGLCQEAEPASEEDRRPEATAATSPAQPGATS